MKNISFLVRSASFAVKQPVFSVIRETAAFACGGTECLVCGKYCGALPVCPSCKDKFVAVSPLSAARRCRICGKVLVSEQELCMQCRAEPVLCHTDGVYPLFSYRLWYTMLLFSWKTAGMRSLSPFFARLVNDMLVQLPPEMILIPVPPRPGKIRKKGWDQIDELCSFLEYRWGYTVCRVLERGSKTEQKTLGREQRVGTIGRSYYMKQGRALRKALAPFGGKIPDSVCIIDDVMTTGSTIECCAAALKGAGVRLVRAVTLFTVD